MDVRYHQPCWRKNVSHFLRKHNHTNNETVEGALYDKAAEYEFLHLLSTTLEEGNILSMSELEDMYNNIRLSNGVHSSQICRRSLKQLITSEIKVVEFHRTKQNVCEKISLKSARDTAIQKNDINPNPILPNSLEYGWYMLDQNFVPVMNLMPPAPESIIHLVKCGCRSSKCATKRCTCVAHNLNALTCVVDQMKRKAIIGMWTFCQMMIVRKNETIVSKQVMLMWNICLHLRHLLN